MIKILVLSLSHSIFGCFDFAPILVLVAHGNTLTIMVHFFIKFLEFSTSLMTVFNAFTCLHQASMTSFRFNELTFYSNIFHFEEDCLSFLDIYFLRGNYQLVRLPILVVILPIFVSACTFAYLLF